MDNSNIPPFMNERHGDYIHLFLTESEYTEKRETGYKEPWLSYVEEGNVNYNKTRKEKMREIPLTFDILTNGVIRWVAESTDYSGITIEYKLNDGEWTEINSATGDSAPSISVSAGDVVQFRGDNAFYANGYDAQWNGFSGTTCSFNAKGNIMSMIDSVNFKDLEEFSGSTAHNFVSFFNSAPIISAEDLILPATSITEDCYSNMFLNCQNLTTAPRELPAEMLEDFCYFGMFKDCTSLTVAPKLPATTLAEGCYNNMFTHCTSLVKAPTLPATGLSLGCYYAMFLGCTSLEKAPQLPATTLFPTCYEEMFYGCTSLTKAPVLPATELANNCYSNMFYGCTSLNYIKCLATGSPYNETWVQNVSPVGTFVKKAGTSFETGVNGIPEGWTVVNIGVSTSVEGVSFYESGGTTQITINSTVPWTATTSDSWLTVSPLTGNSGQTIITATVAATNTKRNGTIIISSSTNNVEIDVTQNDNAMEYLTFDVLSDGNILWKVSGGSSVAKTIEYSKNNSEWIEINPMDSPSISVVTGDSVRFRGYNTRTGQALMQFNAFSGGTANVNIRGNIMSLIDGTNFRNRISMDGCDVYTFVQLFYDCNVISAENLFTPYKKLKNSCFLGLFRGCTSLTTPPALPAMELSDSCYSEMFSGCTALTTAPILPAMVLANRCYQNMFFSCLSLTSTPSLPATTLAEFCYSNMFNYCTGLTTAPALLPATKLEKYCYQYMFSYCFSLTTAPGLPAENLTYGCYYDMFYRCASLTTSPVMSANTLDSYCCTSMFEGCSELTTTPVLRATVLQQYCYQNMFRDCTSLTSTPELPATTLAYYCYSGMFQGCTGLTDATSLPATSISNGAYRLMFAGCASLTGAPQTIGSENGTMGYSSCTQMFSGCTSLVTPPQLPVSALSNADYYEMFAGCTSLTSAPNLPCRNLLTKMYYGMFKGCTSLVNPPETIGLATGLIQASSCTQMFSGCTALTSAPAIPATGSANYCYEKMFGNCKSLTTAPVLPAATLTQYCYRQMFQGCTLLNSIKCLATTVSASNCLTNWVDGVASSGTFIKAASMSSWPSGVSGIPNGWTVQDAS